jgi:hypothetical protein
MTSRISDLTFRIDILYTSGLLEMNQLFPPHKDKAVHSGKSPYGLDNMGKRMASTGKLEPACCRMTAGLPSQ